MAGGSRHGLRFRATDRRPPQVFPLGGGSPVVIGGNTWLQWSPAGDSLWFSGGAIADGRTYIVPLPQGEALPRIPAGGFRSEQEVARLPGARRIDGQGCPVRLLTSTRSIAAPPSAICTGFRCHESLTPAVKSSNNAIPSTPLSTTRSAGPLQPRTPWSWPRRRGWVTSCFSICSVHLFRSSFLRNEVVRSPCLPQAPALARLFGTGT